MESIRSYVSTMKEYSTEFLIYFAYKQLYGVGFKITTACIDEIKREAMSVELYKEKDSRVWTKRRKKQDS